MFSLLLQPFLDRLMDVEQHIEDLRRRTDSLIRLGVCDSVDPAAGRCVVVHGELKTPPIRYMHPSAGEQSETRHPSVGEQCVLVNFGGGENGTLYVALFGLPTTAFPMTSTRAEVTKRVYKDGAASSYDHVAHALDWLNGQVSLNATDENLELKVGEGFLRMSLEGAEVGFGEAVLKFDEAGAHFSGPLVDHEGKLISKK
jgi:phage baseplate assembly protein V